MADYHFKTCKIFLCCGFVDLPGPPRDLKVSDVTRGTCRLTWKPPECDGGDRVKSYFIEKKTVEGKAWTKVQSQTWRTLNCMLVSPAARV